ncbi:MAG TPA: hypothetical protein VNU70_13530, partial [Puia sp.]|nr:hypothetical protein [Puia sp.]
MKKKNWSDRWILCLFVLVSLRCRGQDSFHYRVRLDTPRETDFYKVLLSPEVVARSKEYLGDLRLLGDDGHFVPYVVKDAVDTGGPVYQPLPAPAIVQKDSTDHHSYLTLRWPESYRIDRLSLTIKYPALFKREARILAEASDGSWSQVLLASVDPRDTALRIPAVMTGSLRIDIANADNTPLKIVGVSAGQASIYLLTYLQGG